MSKSQWEYVQGAFRQQIEEFCRANGIQNYRYPNHAQQQLIALVELLRKNGIEPPGTPSMEINGNSLTSVSATSLLDFISNVKDLLKPLELLVGTIQATPATVRPVVELGILTDVTMQLVLLQVQILEQSVRFGVNLTRPVEAFLGALIADPKDTDLPREAIKWLIQQDMERT